MLCRHCGKETENDIKFCPFCGGETDFAKQAPSEPAEKKKKSKRPFVIVIATLLVASIITGAVFILNKNKESEELETVWLLSKVIVVDAEGNKTDRIVLTYDENGNITKKSYGQDVIYEYEDGKCVKESSYSADGELMQYSIIRCDEKGNYLELTPYMADGTELAERYKWKYDKAGSLVEEIYEERYRNSPTQEHYLRFDEKGRKIEEGARENGEILYNYVTEYDEKGNWTRFGDTRYINTYNEDGKLIKVTEVIDSKESFYETYEYDEKGRLVRKTEYYYDGEMSSTKEYEYSDDGRCIKEYKSGAQEGTYNVYELDEKGNCITESSYENGELDSSCLYSYDKNGNFIGITENYYEYSGETEIYEYISVKVTPEKAKQLRIRQEYEREWMALPHFDPAKYEPLKYLLAQ